MIGSYWPAAPDRKPHQWLKPQAFGQWSNGPGRALDVVRRQVPLAEAAGDVAVLGEDPRQPGAALGLRRGVAGERAGELGDRPEADAVLVAPGEQRRARRRADGRHVEAVVRRAHLLHARVVRRAHRAAERVGRAEAGVVDEDEQDVRRTLGRLRPRDHRPVGGGVAQRAARRGPRRCGRGSGASSGPARTCASPRRASPSAVAAARPRRSARPTWPACPASPARSRGDPRCGRRR